MFEDYEATNPAVLGDELRQHLASFQPALFREFFHRNHFILGLPPSLGTFPVAPLEGCIRHSVDFAYGHERTTKQVMHLYAVFFGQPNDRLFTDGGELSAESSVLVERITQFRANMSKSWDIGELGIALDHEARTFPLVAVGFITFVGRRQLGAQTYERFERKIADIRSLERARPEMPRYLERFHRDDRHEAGPVAVHSYDTLLNEDMYRYRYEEAERERTFRRNFGRPEEAPINAIRVFLSYKHESASHNEWVKRLAEDLSTEGINAVLDEWDLHPGESISDYIATNIASCDAMVFIISRGSVDAVEGRRQGGGVRLELRLASARRMGDDAFRIIGVLRSGERAPAQLLDYLWLDFRTAAHYTRALRRLVDSLRQVKRRAREGDDS